jgi:hypothetical protein
MLSPLLFFEENHMVATRSLKLHPDQLQVFSQIGIDTEKVHLISGDSLHPTAVRVDGYTNGHYVFFVSGVMPDHMTFMRYLFGSEHKPSLKTLYMGISIYKSPTAEYIKPENLVSIGTSTDTGELPTY